MEWKKFAVETKNRNPWPLVTEAISISRCTGLALDIGSGGGADSRAMNDAGFLVYAIDSEPQALRNVKGLGGIMPLKIDLAKEKSELPKGKYNMVVAYNSLPFFGRKNAFEIMSETKMRMSKRGVFVFSLFGKDDDFVKRKKAFSVTKEEIYRKFKGWEMVHFIEEHKTEGKKWHILKGILRKR
jgi:2-polyprenyl-3-methyl-5-hydroxy-6-metoxy-1,4-benzoquinol methylase